MQHVFGDSPPDRAISLPGCVSSSAASDRFCCNPNSDLLDELRGQITNYVGEFWSSSDHDIYNEAKEIIAEKRGHLRDSELLCLVVGYVCTRSNRAFGYAEVIDFSFKYLGKALADGTVFNSLRGLAEGGLIEKAEVPASGRAGRQRELYFLTSSGLYALYMAIGLSRHLSAGRRRAVA